MTVAAIMRKPSLMEVNCQRDRFIPKIGKTKPATLSVMTRYGTRAISLGGTISKLSRVTAAAIVASATRKRSNRSDLSEGTPTPTQPQGEQYTTR